MTSNASAPTLFQRFVKREIEDLKCLKVWRGGLAEGVNSLFLCYVVHATLVHDPKTLSGADNLILKVALSAGFLVSVMVMSTAWVSGGNVSPAVTLGLAVQRKVTFVRLTIYVAFHIIGGIAGYAILRGTVPPQLEASMGIVTPAPNVTDGQAVVAEFMAAFLLNFVIMAGIDGGRSDIRESVPLMIGLTVTVGILSCAKTSGAVIDPVIATGPAIFNNDSTALWVYWIGDMLGGGIAGVFYNVLFAVDGGWRRCLRKNKDEYEMGKIAENTYEKETMDP